MDLCGEAEPLCVMMKIMADSYLVLFSLIN